MMQVASLHCYPIKSCGGVSLQEAPLTENGIALDREWVLENNGLYLSQRTDHRLACIKLTIGEDHLTAEAQGFGRLEIPLQRNPDAEQIDVTLRRGVLAHGTAEIDEANLFFSRFLKKKVRLLRLQESPTTEKQDRIDGRSNDRAYNDATQLTLASRRSLKALNAHLQLAVPMDVFRVNIVIKKARAYVEDTWRELQIGDLRAFVVGATRRCSIPNVDQETGILDVTIPVTRALLATRYGIEQPGSSPGKFFGQNLAHAYEPGTVIRVGDTVQVQSKSEAANWNRI